MPGTKRSRDESDDNNNDDHKDQKRPKLGHVYVVCRTCAAAGEDLPFQYRQDVPEDISPKTCPFQGRYLPEVQKLRETAKKDQLWIAGPSVYESDDAQELKHHSIATIDRLEVQAIKGEPWKCTYNVFLRLPEADNTVMSFFQGEADDNNEKYGADGRYHTMCAAEFDLENFEETGHWLEFGLNKTQQAWLESETRRLFVEAKQKKQL